MANTERLTRTPSSASAFQAEGWWTRYQQSLKDSSLTPTAVSVIEADSRYILEAGILGVGRPEEGDWPITRQRSGLVMGAVQSGKTASMLGVTALALDAGIDVVVVLAGTRVSLWRQTYERLMTQLSPPESALVFPLPKFMDRSEDQGRSLTDLYSFPGARIRRALSNNSPIIMVVMKQSDHLRAASRMIHETVIAQCNTHGKPIQLLVLDDEADDGSILDALVESDLDPSQDVFKQIPRHIVDLWSTRITAPATADRNFFATYLAYTATPQANFLQADINPLAPRDFVSTLRTPSVFGELLPRSSTYREPMGLQSYYTGGEMFYRTIEGVGSLVVDDRELPSSEEDLTARQQWIASALRAYLVAGAIRLWRTTPELPLTGLAERRFNTREEARAACPSPHTMLFHPSSSVEDHFDAAAELLEWGSGLSSEAAQKAIAAGVRQFDLASLKSDLVDNEGLWTHWISEFTASAAALSKLFAEDLAAPTAALDDWPRLREILETEIIPNVRIAVINSDPQADERPEFDVAQVEDEWRAPRDIYTIFVSGNVMARGLTLEGLATTLFLRSSTDPLSDTQMQMQRWFGYRGKFLNLCRVFLPAKQLQLFIQYNEADEAHRRQIIQAMNESGNVAPTPMVLESLDYRATGKIAGVSKVPLSPGANPFLDVINDGATSDPNLDLLRELFEQPSVEVCARGTLRGRILDRPLSLEQAASLLDRLSFAEYTPDSSDPSSTRWADLEFMLGKSPNDVSPQFPLFRPPHNVGLNEAANVSPGRCPYNIAAYLRLWSAALERHARGLFPTDNGDTPWASLDLEQRRRLAPEFWVGMRYGSGTPFTLISPTLGAHIDEGLKIVPMRRSIHSGYGGRTWGSRNPGSEEDSYLGDQLFDYHHHESQPIPTALAGGPLWRPLGAPGQILFQVLEDPQCTYPVVAVGVSIPLGGPDHFAARVRNA